MGNIRENVFIKTSILRVGFQGHMRLLFFLMDLFGFTIIFRDHVSIDGSKDIDSHLKFNKKIGCPFLYGLGYDV